MWSLWFSVQLQTRPKTHISRKHTNYNEEALSIKCYICTREFKCSKELKKHMICNSYTDSSTLNDKCDECDFWGPNRFTLEMHFRKIHSENIWCGVCEFEAKDIETLDIHTFTCEIYKCNTCKQNFQSLQDLKAHINKEYNGKNKLLNRFCCERDNQEFYQEKKHISPGIFSRKSDIPKAELNN